jgi:hypothetical protein
MRTTTTATTTKAHETTVKITIDPSKIAKGHQPHRSGAGQHAHRSTKRNRTRSQQKTTALRDW